MAVYNLEPIEEDGTVSKEKPVDLEIESAGVIEQKDISESVLERGSEGTKENYEKILERVKTQTQSSVEPSDSLVKADILSVSSVDEEARIQKLVNIALEKNPEHAFKVAIELDDMYALDMLHDQLSHKLYQELVSKGLLKEEG